MCPNCGAIKEDITLSDRTFICDSCGYTEERDVKAAKTMLLAGRSVLRRSGFQTSITRMRYGSILRNAQRWERDRKLPSFRMEVVHKCWKNLYETIDKIFLMSQYNPCIRRRVEQLAAHRAHNPGVVGSSPTPAKQGNQNRFDFGSFFIFL